MEQAAIIDSMKGALYHLGLPGVFFASFIGNVIPYSAVPYLAFIAAYSAGMETESRIAIALVGGAGAASGKYVLYGIARYAGRFLSERRKEELSYFQEILSKGAMGFLAVFLFAALPLPDDVLYVPLGVARYNFILFSLAVFFGKVFLAGIAVFLGRQARWLLMTTFETGHLLLGIIALIAATVVLLMVLLFTNWKLVFITLTEKGAWEASKVFLREILLVLTFRHESFRKRV